MVRDASLVDQGRSANTISKTKIFWDCDDTILKSGETIVDILNKRYDISPPKTINDCTDWNFKSIYGGMTHAAVKEIFESEEFWNNVQAEEEFIKFFNIYNKVTDNYAVTKGTQKNLSLKKEWFAKCFPSLQFIPCDYGEPDKQRHDKSSVDMTDGIQLDDRFDALATTNAAIKILITHGRKLPWNKVEYPVDNLYIVKDISEALTVVKYFIENPEFVRATYAE